MLRSEDAAIHYEAVGYCYIFLHLIMHSHGYLIFILLAITRLVL